MTSDQPVTSEEPADIGSADGSLDPVDVVRGLAHLDVLRDRIAVAAACRGLASVAPPRNSVERHARDYGHRLSEGCCRPDIDRGVAA